MKTHQEQKSEAPWPKEMDEALDAQGRVVRKPRPTLRDQIVTAYKLFTIAGVLLLALWLVDQMVGS